MPSDEPSHTVGRSLAAGYLRPKAGAFWAWADDGRELVWRDGGLIAFWPQVQEVLEAIPARCLPPFDAVVVLLAACERDWPQRSEQTPPPETPRPGGWWTLGRGLPPLIPEPVQATPRRLRTARAVHQRMQEVVKALQPVHEAALAAENEGGLSRPDLARVVFSKMLGHQSRSEQDAIRSELVRGVDPAELVGPSDPAADTPEAAGQALDCALLPLKALLATLDPDRLRDLARTGVEHPPEPAPVKPPEPPAETDADGEEEAPAARRVRELLDRALTDERLRPLAGLSKQVLAAISVPRRVGEPEDLPLGGFSDLSPRGTPDRLLVSELANDPLVLAVRVAMNEALHLRREQPPKQPHGSRAILLDTGIRLWGLPRLFAAAVGLALVAKTDEQTSVHVWRTAEAGGEAIEPADLTRREGVLAHLETLNPEPEPGEALRRLYRELDELATGPESDRDVMLVTHRAVLDDPDFQPALREAARRHVLYVATVQRDGVLEWWRVHSRSGASVELSRRSWAKLELAELWQGEQRAQHAARIKQIVAQGSGELPAVLSLDPFPLMLPHQVSGNRAVRVTDHGVVSLSKDGRLLHWFNRQKGPRQLRTDVPGGGPCQFWVPPRAARAWVLTGQLKDGRSLLFTVDLKQQRCTRVALPAQLRQVQAICGHGGVLLVVFRNAVEAYDPHSGHLLSRTKLPAGLRHRWGRFFEGGRAMYPDLPPDGPTPVGWWALSYDGRIRVEPLTAGFTPAGEVRAVFDREGEGGPWLIDSSGAVRSLADGECACRWPTVMPPGLIHGNGPDPAVDVPTISRDGHRVAWCAWPAGRSRSALLVHLQTGAERSWEPLPNHAAIRRLDPQPADEVQPRPVRINFRAVAVDGPQRLVLLGKRDHRLALELDPMGQRLRLHPLSPDEGPAAGGMTRLEPIDSPADARYRLHRAQMPGGGRIILDSRGLLHLIGPSREQPQVAIVLDANGPLSAWASTGQTCGDAYFFANQPDTPPGTFFHQLIKPLISRFGESAGDS